MGKSQSQKKQTQNSRKILKPVSELRRDLVTRDWVTIATLRAKRPHAFIAKERKELIDPISVCPFEDPQASGNAPPFLLYHGSGSSDWSLQVIPNKYPAFAQIGECLVPRKHGPYEIMDGRGEHEVIITRDHAKHLAILSREEVTEVIRAYQERFHALKEGFCANYISIFHNHGKGSGASISHPHSQLIAIPVVPSDVRRSLHGSERFYQEHGTCVHCAMNNWEREEGKRIIFENDSFMVFCPFVSRAAFELRIFPKEHQAHFEDISPALYGDFADALRTALRGLYDTLENPSYNFFIHTAPFDSKETYAYYHWHVEIIPHTAVRAGFELGTGIEISPLAPEEAAEFLKENGL